MVVFSPWPFGSIDPLHEFYLSLAVFALAALWGAHAALTGRFAFRPDVVSVALAGLVAWTAFQLVPLPEGLLGVISPGRAEWHRTLLPAVEEVLPGEAAGVPRAGAAPLSVNPAATRALLARLLTILIVYAAARNWLADRDSLPRLLGALLAVGVALAFFAVWQAAAGPAQTLFWTVRVPTSPFGPFVNRNHYPDYAALCAGGGLGLLLRRPEGGEEWLSGRRFALALAVTFILLTIPPSLSRGGMLATFAAAAGTWVLSRVGRDDLAGGWGRLALAGAVGLTLVAAVTLGLGQVEGRLATLGDREQVTTEGRLPTWKNVTVGLVPRFPLAGTGGGTFEAVEPTVRTDPSLAGSNYEYAHNEYLEALVEGGVVRLALTLLLVGGCLLVVGRGAVARRDRSVGGPLLGLWFGLTTVALHAVGEFAVHLPAVATTTAIVAGYAMAAAGDSGFVPQRVKVRRKPRRSRRGDRPVELPAAESVVVDAVPTPAEPDPGRRWVGRGPAAWLAGLAVAAAALVVAADSRTRARAAAYELAAVAVARGNLPADDPTAQRVVYAEARATVRPDDPNGQLVAAEARLQAAYERTVAGTAGLLGGAGGWVARADRLADGPDVRAAAGHLRAARRASPVAARAHARLGLLADHVRGEPAAVHFDRAKRLLPADPEVWYAAGREAFARGDRAAALADWQRTLALSAGRLPDILAQVRGMSVDDLRANLLPPEPAVSVAAADALFPDRLRQAAERRPFLVAAVAQAQGKVAATGDDWAAAARAAAELGRDEQALEFWRAAVNNAPRSIRVRDGFALWLEGEERYEEAVDQLRQLQKLADSPTLQDRIEACYHGLKLKRAIGE